MVIVINVLDIIISIIISATVHTSNKGVLDI